MAKLNNITVNVSLNGPLDVEKLAEEFKASIRKEVEMVGVKFEVANQEYRKVTDRKPKAGDFVKFRYTSNIDITNGKYYEITEVDSEGDPQIIDDAGDEYDTYEDKFEVYEPVVKYAPELKVGDYAKVVTKATSSYGAKIGDIVKLVAVNGAYNGFRTEDLFGGNFNGNHSGSAECFVRATDEEVAEAKAKLVELEKWAKIGRKPYEFKKGDIVRVHKPCGAQLKIGQLIEVIQDSKSIGVKVSGDWAVIAKELIAPVESRFDRD